MRVLVTGAGGFIGATLLELLQRERMLGDKSIDALAAVDRHLQSISPGVTSILGDLGEKVTIQKVLDFQPNVVFHLAAVPGGTAEEDYELGRRVNLDATLALFEALAVDGRSGGAPVVVVYASTIAVYGVDLPQVVEPSTPLRPPITYGAHKLACETILADFSRRQWLDGRSVRLPGIVARPRSPSGLVSAFMSDLLHALAAGEEFVCPVGPGATAWWMSAQRCAENLAHAAVMNVRETCSARAWPLPVLRLSIREVVQTMAEMYGESRMNLIRFEPVPQVETVFGRYPKLDDNESRSLGLRDDETAVALVKRALGVA